MNNDFLEIYYTKQRSLFDIGCYQKNQVVLYKGKPIAIIYVHADEDFNIYEFENELKKFYKKNNINSAYCCVWEKKYYDFRKNAGSL